MLARPARAAGLALAVALGALAPASPAAAVDVVARPADGVFVLDGRGFGHGRGMSQYGAYGAALQGRSHEEILAFYYPAATLGTAAGTLRRVLLTAEDADLDVVNGPGLRLRDEASGASADLGAQPGWTRVRVRHDAGRLLAEALQGDRWVPVPVGGAADGVLRGPAVFEGPAVIGVQPGDRRYRGRLVAALSGQPAKPLYVVNHVGLDDYVRGVVPAEMPASWSAEAVQAQAVAARSYGMQPCPQPSAFPAVALYDVVDTTACQVYGGVRSEAPGGNDAVAATAGQVLRSAPGGPVLRAEFSSSNGGWTVPGAGAPTPREDPFDAVGAQAGRSVVHRWTGVRVPAASLEAAFGTGPLREVRVLARDGRGEWGGRVERVRLVGAARTVEVTGAQFRSAAGLRSTWFDLVQTAQPDIDAHYQRLGGPASFLGQPVNPESVPPDGVGRYRHYQGGSIYWHPTTGSHEVHGRIRDAWARLGWELGPLGYPSTDETGTPDRVGRYNHFQHGSVYWSPRTDAHEVRGAIRDAWARLGWEAGPLGYPVTDESGTPDRVGRYNHFERGSVYWTPRTGAHEVRGAIRDAWARMGWERSSLGYPTSDEYDVPGGRASDFQRGRLRWDGATGAVNLVPR